ncbi:hypothetical protein GALMADRAFT_135125 [Galerina marginata CBS 339.88]|uniref:Inositol-pentakisphosphate 2-kinase n=1 Tax=Galerina marginata (strain CBS 339.88) TaxID=685588 RepID=A0A067TRV8_GALM3|nr:hypothetical protein GALMADRAFT_135125 [Galerina marginata CBS 339.88]
MADIVQSKPNDWAYVSEGGATIVFSYRGPPHPAFSGTVLRLRKSAVVPTGSGNTTDPGRTRDENEPDDPTIEYQTKCMQKLIPLEHLPQLQTVRLDRSWLEALVQLQNLIRPEGRREKDEVDLNRTKGVLATDLVGGNWLAVEIKPKWAFLPSPIHLSKETKLIKTQTCRFCMHSHLKAQKGQEIPTDYCPLDLFSGDENRVTKAIHGLWDAWVASNATANNLKIFARGKFVSPSEAHLMFKDGLTGGENLLVIRDAFAISLVRPLLHTPVLRILSKLQRELDVLDIEGLSKLWRLTEASSPLYQTTFASFVKKPSDGSQSAPSCTSIGMSSPFLQAPEPAISDWVDFLETYMSPDKRKLDHANPLPENLHHYLMSYLLSATFKDCSVIVNLDFLEASHPREDAIKPESVTIIDLDPKSMKKLSTWEKLDQEIAHAYATAQRRVCIDQWQVPRAKSS